MARVAMTKSRKYKNCLQHLQVPGQTQNTGSRLEGCPNAGLTQAVSCAGIFTAAGIQQIKGLFQDSLLAVEKDGTIQVQTFYPQAACCHTCPGHQCSVPIAVAPSIPRKRYYQDTLQVGSWPTCNGAWQETFALSTLYIIANQQHETMVLFIITG